MADFSSAVTRVPTSIGRIWHIIQDNPSTADSVRYVYEILDQNGDVMETRRGDEMDYISSADKTNLQAFVNNQRTKANTTLP
jgi:hypothetical protein